MLEWNVQLTSSWRFIILAQRSSLYTMGPKVGLSAGQDCRATRKVLNAY